VCKGEDKGKRVIATECEVKRSLRTGAAGADPLDNSLDRAGESERILPSLISERVYLVQCPGKGLVARWVISSEVASIARVRWVVLGWGARSSRHTTTAGRVANELVQRGLDVAALRVRIEVDDVDCGGTSIVLYCHRPDRVPCRACNEVLGEPQRDILKAIIGDLIRTVERVVE